MSAATEVPPVAGAPTTGRSAASGEITAAPGASQGALTVRVNEKGQVWTRICSTAPCALATGVAPDLDVSSQLEALGASAAPRLAVVELGQNRRVVHVQWGVEPSYHLVLGAPLGGAGSSGAGSKAPDTARVMVVHQGWSDRWSGLEGERVTSHVEVVGNPGTKQQLVVGELRENITLCGRPALLSPALLDPSSLTLKPARLQRLSARERKAAAVVVAESVEESSPGAMTLQALAASSAVGKPSAISDGNLETTWAEGGGGAGKGEFIVLRTPSDVALQGFELVARPPSGGAASAAAPRSFWLVGDTQMVRVDVPRDPWTTPGQRVRIRLPEPWRTSCVAWVAEDAHGEGADLQVTIAELVALPEEGALSSEELVQRIRAGGDDVASAVSMLAARPQEAGPLVAVALTEASETARGHLLDVVDRLSCAEAAPAYAAALAVGGGELEERAGRGLRRCGDVAPPVLVDALRDASPSAEIRLAQELSLLAPALAVETLTPRLTTSKVSVRAGLRRAIARASQETAAHESLRALLRDEALPEVAQVDLLRALGRRVEQHRPDAVAALLRLAEKASFRTRYLLVKPAAYLAAVDRHAAAFVARSLASDESPAVRTAAAEAIGETFADREAVASFQTKTTPFEAELVAALDDENVRVREAAARTLGVMASQGAGARLQRALEKDRWPLVRRSAADALARLGPEEQLDLALGHALGEDESPEVRAAAARALGRRGSPRAGEWLRDALTNDEQPSTVRQEAARALGDLCFAGASSALIQESLRLRNPHLDPEERRVAVAALRSLARLRPAGLESELGPLLGDRVPKQVRSLAKKAVGPDDGGSCSASRRTSGSAPGP